jgi:hypothetical protein
MYKGVHMSFFKTIPFVISIALVGCSEAMLEQLKQVKAQNMKELEQERLEEIEFQKALPAMIQASTPYCTSEPDCNAKWAAAKIWVVKHAEYKIQTISDVLIQTVGPFEFQGDLAASVRKESMGAGKYAIKAVIKCGSNEGCMPDAQKSLLDFNQTVNAAHP